MSSICKKVILGETPTGIPEFKVEWHGHPIPHPETFTRTSKLIAEAEFCGPEVTINGAWADIENCAKGAAAVAGLVAIFGSAAAALPSFKAAFVACLVAKIGAKADEIQVQLSTHQEAGDWHKV